MPKKSPARFTRFIGGYLTFIGVAMVVCGVLLRWFFAALTGLSGAGAGATPEEFESSARMANWFTYPVIALGLGFAAYGIFRIVRPVQVREDKSASPQLSDDAHSRE
jgi:hypothetical protein